MGKKLSGCAKYAHELKEYGGGSMINGIKQLQRKSVENTIEFVNKMPAWKRVFTRLKLKK